MKSLSKFFHVVILPIAPPSSPIWLERKSSSFKLLQVLLLAIARAPLSCISLYVRSTSSRNFQKSFFPMASQPSTVILCLLKLIIIRFFQILFLAIVMTPLSPMSFPYNRSSSQFIQVLFTIETASASPILLSFNPNTFKFFHEVLLPIQKAPFLIVG